MITPLGGVRLPTQPTPFVKQAKLQATGTRVYLRLPDENAYTLCVSEGETVASGTLIAKEADGTPVYAPVSGRFDGVFSNGGREYAGVTDDGKGEKSPVFAPETRPLGDIPAEELLEKVKMLGILDVRGGDRLWRTLSRASGCFPEGAVPKLIIDATDASGCSFTNYIQALQTPSDLIGGAVLLARLLGTGRIILLVDADRQKAIRTLTGRIGGNPLFALAKTVACYPMRDEMIYEMLYMERIPKGSSMNERGIFITDAQTAVQFCRAMLTGMPQTVRWLTAAGEGFAQQAVVCLPLGTPWQNVLAACKFRGEPYRTMINSPIRGEEARGVCEGDAVCVISSLPKEHHATHCISCGHCGEVCPMRLQPRKILFTRRISDVQALVSDCVGCGCCEYACPAYLPLAEMIAEYKSEPKEESEDA